MEPDEHTPKLFYSEITRLVSVEGKSENGDGENNAAGDHGRALWFRTTINQHVSTGSLACPFARSFAPLTHSRLPNSWESESLDSWTSSCSEP